MKAFLFTVILYAATFAIAQEPAAGADSSDVVGTIQEPSHQNKKIVKKIMTRKENGTAQTHHPKKKHHGKKHSTKTDDTSGTK